MEACSRVEKKMVPEINEMWIGLGGEGDREAR